MGSMMGGAYRCGKWAKPWASPRSASVNLKGLLWRSCERAVSPRYYEKACNPGSCWKKWHRETLDPTVPLSPEEGLNSPLLRWRAVKTLFQWRTDYLANPFHTNMRSQKPPFALQRKITPFSIHARSIHAKG